MSIEKIQRDGTNIFIGVIEFDDCQEVMDNFDGEIQGDRYIVRNSDEVIAKLFKDDLIGKGEKISLENCDYLAFTGVNSKI